MVLFSVLSYSSTEEYFCLISFSDLISLNFYYVMYRSGYSCCLTISVLKCSRVSFWRLPNYVAFYCSKDLEGWSSCLLLPKLVLFLGSLLHFFIFCCSIWYYCYHFSLFSPSESLLSSAICTVLRMNLEVCHHRCVCKTWKIVCSQTQLCHMRCI